MYREFLVGWYIANKSEDYSSSKDVKNSIGKSVK
jgi:hypothetical protein